MDTARKTVFLLLWLMLAPALCLAMEDAEITRPGQPVSWTAAPSGAECAALAHTVRKADGDTRRVLIHALRFAPERFEFPLFSSRWEGAKVKTMREWTEQKELVAAVKRVPMAKVNLIPLSPVDHRPDFKTPPESTMLMFLDVLMKNRVQTMIRRSRGKESQAACGQLRLRRTAASASAPVV